jgi:trimeric autotransporter adhesin
MGSNNTMLGASADISQDGLFNCVAIGKSSTCTASNQVRLGNSSTTSIGGIVGFSNLSDGRYKKNIQEAVKGIDFIMKLRPVTYQLDMAGINKKLNINAGKMDDQLKRSVAEQEKTVFSGFVAQEVEQASKAAGYDFSGVDKPKNENDMYGLRYAEFVVPLVKAMQEQQQMIIDLKKQNEDLQKRVLALEKK